MDPTHSPEDPKSGTGFFEVILRRPREIQIPTNENPSLSKVPPATCRSCGAGRMIGFNWDYAREKGLGLDLDAFQLAENLRRGTLYQCRDCGHPWYLAPDSQVKFMNAVNPDRLPLIHRWNEKPILLSPDHERKLAAIGRTPPDHYGNGKDYHQTPCGVVTTSGEKIDLAIVSQQGHAPYENGRACRLADEIGDIYPSPFALSLAVRLATTRASEISMGFAPTLVETPDGKLFTLNWTTHFFVKPGIRAGDLAVSQKGLDRQHLPEIYAGGEAITYFIADSFRS